MSDVRASDGVRLHAEAHGEGVPLVLSCGFATTCENFRPQVEPLVAAGARVVLWDYRGHGRSDAPADPAAYSLEQVVDDLGRVLDWAAGDGAADSAGGAGAERTARAASDAGPAEVARPAPLPAILAGHSLGGLVSLHLALAHPERVRGLALLGSGPGFKNPDAAARWAAQIERTAELLETRGMQALLRGRAAATTVGRHPETPEAERAARAIAAQDPKAVAAFGRRVAGPAPPVIDRLGEIRAPALVLVGAEDAPYLRAADVMTARLPHARKQVIPGAGHIASLEAPDAVCDALAAFVRELEADAGADEGHPSAGMDSAKAGSGERSGASE